MSCFYKSLISLRSRVVLNFPSRFLSSVWMAANGMFFLLREQVNGMLNRILRRLILAYHF